MKKSIQAFTLLEVLVALAVASIGLAAVIKVAGGNAYNAQYLQERTLAQWVAMNQLAVVQGLNALPEKGKTSGQEDLGGRTWYWRQEVKDARINLVRKELNQLETYLRKNLREVEVRVYTEERQDDNAIASVTTLVGQP